MSENNIAENTVESKACSKCGKSFPATGEYFSIRSGSKDGLRANCRICESIQKKKYRETNKDILLIKKKKYLEVNKKAISERRRKRWKKNKVQISIRRKKEYKENRVKLIAKTKAYTEKNKGKVKKFQRGYYLLNKDKIILNVSKNKNSVAKYKNYKDKLQKFEKIRESIIYPGMIEVKCAYCGKWFQPTVRDVEHRVSCFNGNTNGEARFYCPGDQCRKACPTYGRIKWPKGFKKSTSREVNPLIRQMCFKRDDYTCQKCGSTIKDTQLHCHHIEGATQQPLLSNDLTNVVTLCKSCHKLVHKKPGCGYHELKCHESGNIKETA